MFSHLIFLILAVLIVTFSQGLPQPSWITSMWFTAGVGALFYFLLLLLIFYQGKASKRKKGVVYNLVQIELLTFLALYLFALGGNGIFSNSQAANGFLAMLLYFAGLAVFHYSWSSQEGEALPQLTAEQQLRLIFPFVIPFLLFLLMLDLLGNFAPLPIESGTLWVIELAFIALTFFFLPPLLVGFWQCSPMRNGALRDRLEKVCQRAHFKHGGIFDWTILNRSHTAAILGAFFPFRYLLFTESLQKDLSEESIEAILAHEIGHSQRRHLLWYPAILFGGILVLAFYTVYGTPWIEAGFSGTFLYPFAVLLPYGVILWLYFRYVFGFFSRLFERQADLHCFELNIPVDHMITALDDVAKATGFIHSAPNWHHYSIAERIAFLEKAKENPKLIKRHHIMVKMALLSYVVILLLGLYFLESYG